MLLNSRGEKMDSEKILVILGYILAVFFPLIGVIYGLILYFIKGETEFIKKHAKYIIIVGVIFIIINLILVTTMGISLLAMSHP